MTKTPDPVDIPRALAHLDPTAPWVLDGDGYDGLTWLGDGPKPTMAELRAADTEAKAAAVAATVTAQTELDAATERLSKAGLSLADLALLIRAAT